MLTPSLTCLTDVNPEVLDSLHEGRVAALRFGLGALPFEELFEVADESAVLLLRFLLGLLRLLVVLVARVERVGARGPRVARWARLVPVGKAHADPLMKKAHAGFFVRFFAFTARPWL